MADRKDWGFRQKVTQAEMDAESTYMEAGERNIKLDHNIFGVIKGLVPTLSGASSVQVTSGIAFDQFGKRVKAFYDGSANKIQSYATDTAGATTAVAGGQERWISIYALAGRNALDPRVDGNVVTFYHDQPECLHDGTSSAPANVAGLGGTGVDKFLIVAGNSVASGTGIGAAPTLRTDAILLCDIKRTNADASNTIDFSRRMVYAIKDSTAVGTNGSAGNGLAILMSALTTWAGGRTSPAAASLNAQLSQLITDLAATASSDDGAERIGAQASGNMSSGSVRSQLDFLDANKAGLSLANAFTNNNTFTGKISVKPVASGSSGAGIDTGAVALSGTRTCLFEASFSGGGGPTYRIYLNDVSMYAVTGPANTITTRRSLLFTTNARWDGTNWNNDVTTTPSEARAAFAIELLPWAGGSSNDDVAGPGFILYRRPHNAGATTWNDAGWTQKVDAATPRSPGNGAAIATAGYTGTGTNQFNWLNGEMFIGQAGVSRFQAFGQGGQAGSSFTLKTKVTFLSKFTATPSSIGLSQSTGTNITAASMAVSTSAYNFTDITCTVTAAGAYFADGSVQPTL